MLPAHAPLPTACSLPFHPEAGSHTSILMSESVDGVNVAATRQKAGRLANAFPPRPPPRAFGSANCPAATVCASVTWTCGSANVERLSHVAPIAGAATSRKANASFIMIRGGPEGPALLLFFEFPLVLRIHRLRAAHCRVERQVITVE